jgi:myo-inositol 2-dehydrogenase/D-chiro-inositol 1-dehydrogenase
MSVGLGFIGAGTHARHHMKEFAHRLPARLVAAYDIDPSRVDEAIREFPGLRSADSLGALLSDPEVEAVIIATPAETHRELVVAALEAGKDALLEKPLAHTAGEARAIVEAAERHPERILMIGHCERFNRAYIDARKAIDDGHVGTPRFAAATRITPMKLNDPTWALGALDTAVHDVDLLLWLLGDRPVSVAAQGTTLQAGLSIPDQVTYQIRFANGALAQGHIGWIPFSGGYPLSGNAHPRLFLAGTAGILSLDLWQRPVAVHCHETGAYFWADDVLVGYGDYFTEVTAQDHAFLKAVETRGPVQMTAREAYQALRVTYAAHESLTRHDGAFVSLDA